MCFERGPLLSAPRPDRLEFAIALHFHRRPIARKPHRWQEQIPVHEKTARTKSLSRKGDRRQICVCSKARMPIVMPRTLIEDGKRNRVLGEQVLHMSSPARRMCDKSSGLNSPASGSSTLKRSYAAQDFTTVVFRSS